jgi:hypothetical protein
MRNIPRERRGEIKPTLTGSSDQLPDWARNCAPTVRRLAKVGGQGYRLAGPLARMNAATGPASEAPTSSAVRLVPATAKEWSPPSHH